MKINKFYIPYNETDRIDYIFLLRLYQIAEYNKENKTFSLIIYKSFQELAERLETISASSLRRALLSPAYERYFEWCEKEKTIILKNDCRKGNGNNKFIMLSKEETDFLIEYNDNFLIKYYFYQKYFCGYTKEHRHNSTAKQILETIGYSSTSGRYITKISSCNRVLEERGFLNIFRYTEENGKKRNFYSLSIG